MLSNLSNCVGLNNPARLVSVDAVAKGIVAFSPSLLVICNDISLRVPIPKSVTPPPPAASIVTSTLPKGSSTNVRVMLVPSMRLIVLRLLNAPVPFLEIPSIADFHCTTPAAVVCRKLLSDLGNIDAVFVPEPTIKSPAATHASSVVMSPDPTMLSRSIVFVTLIKSNLSN